MSWPWRVTSGLHRSFVHFWSVLLNSNNLTSCLSLLLFLFHLLFASNPFIMVAHKNVQLKWIAARRCCYSSRRRKRWPEREREKETIGWWKRQLARLIKVRIIWDLLRTRILKLDLKSVGLNQIFSSHTQVYFDKPHNSVDNSWPENRPLFCEIIYEGPIYIWQFLDNKKFEFS